MKKFWKTIAVFFMVILLAACNQVTAEEEQKEKTTEQPSEPDKKDDTATPLKNNIELSSHRGFVGDKVGLPLMNYPDTEHELVWITYEGRWDLGTTCIPLSAPSLKKRNRCCFGKFR